MNKFEKDPPPKKMEKKIRGKKSAQLYLLILMRFVRFSYFDPWPCDKHIMT